MNIELTLKIFWNTYYRTTNIDFKDHLINLKRFTGSRTIYIVCFIQLPTRQGWIELIGEKSNYNLMIQYYLTKKVMEIYVQSVDRLPHGGCE